MTVYTTRLGGSNWADGDILYAADQNETITRSANEPWYKIDYDSTAGDSGLIKFSSTIWQTATGITANGGSTWAAGGYNATAAEDIADASSTQGIAFDQSDGSAAYTSDSGTTWQASSTQPPNVANINCCSLFNTTVGVAGGEDTGAGKTIWVTTNGGDDWAQATTGPTEEVSGIVMCSATIGFAIDTSNNIWRTANGGVDWADTTINASYEGVHMFAVSTDEVWYFQRTWACELYKYVHSTTTNTQLLNLETSDSTLGSPSNIVTATNGNYYWAGWSPIANGPSFLTLFKYDGSNFYTKMLGIPGYVSSVDKWKTSTYGAIRNLIEVSDVLYLNIARHIMEINVEDE